MQLFNLQAANSIGDRIRRNAVMRNIPQRSRSIGPTTQGTRYTIQTNVWDPSLPSHQQQLIKILRILKTLPDETISNRRLNTWSHISISVLHVCQFERRNNFNVKKILYFQCTKRIFVMFELWNKEKDVFVEKITLLLLRPLQKIFGDFRGKNPGTAVKT